MLNWASPSPQMCVMHTLAYSIPQAAQNISSNWQSQYPSLILTCFPTRKSKHVSSLQSIVAQYIKKRDDEPTWWPQGMLASASKHISLTARKDWHWNNRTLPVRKELKVHVREVTPSLRRFTERPLSHGWVGSAKQDSKWHTKKNWIQEPSVGYAKF